MFSKRRRLVLEPQPAESKATDRVLGLEALPLEDNAAIGRLRPGNG